MARVEVTRRALSDLERIFGFIAAESPDQADRQVESIRRAFVLLAEHPLLGHPAGRSS
jgi:plasmid stabilization system protein ParE